MSTYILHHAGHAAMRVPATVALAGRDVVLVATAQGDDHVQLKAAGCRVWLIGARAPDTLDETARAVSCLSRGDVLYVSTEAGHIGRATLIARILCVGRGIAVRSHPAPPAGPYRSPWWLTARDAARAVVARLTGRVR